VRRVHGLTPPRRNRSPLSVTQDDGQRQKPYPRLRAARQPPPHLQTIAGGKAKNRSPRPTRKTGTRFTRRRTRRRKSDNSCDGTRKKARNKSRAFVISVEGGLNSPCRPCLSLSQTEYDWLEATNRLNLLLDERALQADLVRADRIFPIANLAGSRDPGASPSAQCPAAEITQAADLRQHRSADICWAI
jgi:hypothetical protein